MIVTLEKIKDLLRKENFKYEYNYHIVENCLYLSLPKEQKINSMYHWNFLYYDYQNGDKLSMSSYSDEYEKYEKYLSDNNLLKCIEIGGEQFVDHKEFRVNVYNNINSRFTTSVEHNIEKSKTPYDYNDYDNHFYHKHYIINDSYIVEFVELYVIPTMHSVEKCTELMIDNYHFTQKSMVRNFSSKLLIETRKKKIENVLNN